MTTNPHRFACKVTFVTGAGNGIGRATAIAFAPQGASVVAADRSEDCSLNTAKSIETLFVTEGEGFVQARGGTVMRIRPGDVVRITPGEEHWHGATANNFMTHLALTEGDTVWGNHLTDAEYPTE